MLSIKKMLENRTKKKEQQFTGKIIDLLKSDQLVINAAAKTILDSLARGEDCMIDRGTLKRMKKALVPFHADTMEWK